MYSTSQGLQGKLRALRRHENHCDPSQNVGFIKKLVQKRKWVSLGVVGVKCGAWKDYPADSS